MGDPVEASFQEELREVQAEREAAREVLADELDALQQRAEAAEADARALRRCLFAAAEILDHAVSTVDRIWPNDAEPEMQTALHEIAEKLRALSDSKVGRVTGPDALLADGAREARLMGQKAEAERDRLRGALEQILRQGRNLDCICCGLRDKVAQDALVRAALVKEGGITVLERRTRPPLVLEESEEE